MDNPNDTCIPDVGPLPATEYQLGYCKDVMHGTVTDCCMNSYDNRHCYQTMLFLLEPLERIPNVR